MNRDVASWAVLRRGFILLVLALGLVGADTSGQNARAKAQKLFYDGFELLKAGKPKEAAPKFEEALHAEPGNALGHFYLAEAYRSLKQTEQAKEHYAKSLQLDPKSQVANDARARLAELTAPPQTAAQTGPSPGTEFQDCDVCPAMVVVPAGKFVMGSPPSEPGRRDDEGPPHTVAIAQPFAVGKFEVTFDEWDACVADRQCGAAKDEGWGRGRRPVINVSWEQAVGYTEWLSDKTGKKYRLLSEAEREYSAWAGTTTVRFWGDSAGRACIFANVNDSSFGCNDGFEYTAPVGSFKPNAFGLYDMLGNVWEWVADCYNKTYDGAPTDGSAWSMGDCSLRVLRGGSWFYPPPDVRSASRNRSAPSGRGFIVGFRVARTLP